MRTFKFIAAILIICMAVISFLLKVYPRYYFVGINKSGVDVAKIAIAKNLGPSECFRIVRFDPFDSPSTSTQENLCIYTYAELTKDPSACELLMPSDYGFSCIGAATKFLPCLFDDQKNVVWNDGQYHKVPFDKCSTVQDSGLGESCCLAAASRFDPDFLDGCSRFKKTNPLLADQCQYEVSLKEVQSNLCTAIEDENVHAACSLEVSVLENNPQFLENYPFAKH